MMRSIRSYDGAELTVFGLTMPFPLGVSRSRISLLSLVGLLLWPEIAWAIPNNISLKRLMIGLEPVVDFPSDPAPSPNVQSPAPVEPSSPPLSWSTIRASQRSTSSRSQARRSLPSGRVSGHLSDHPSASSAAAPVRSSQTSFPSFSSAPLDRQLRRYLSYVEAVGPADIFIVGSSRATQGVDPLVLQQALAQRGFKDLKVFNWGIHGATAQVVELLLTEILPPEQLPRMVVWADGSRSFSRGRYDQTYENIRRSPGYRALRQGKRPLLTTTERQQLRSFQVALQAEPPPLPTVRPRTTPSPQASRKPLQLKAFIRKNKRIAKNQPVPQHQKPGYNQPGVVAQVPPRFIDWCTDIQGPCSDLDYSPNAVDPLWEENDPTNVEQQTPQRPGRTGQEQNGMGENEAWENEVGAIEADAIAAPSLKPRSRTQTTDPNRRRGLPPLPDLSRSGAVRLQNPASPQPSVDLPVLPSPEDASAAETRPEPEPPTTLQAVRRRTRNSGPVLFDARLYLQASGFKINTAQFNPNLYFQRHKRIPGDYDGDYQNFSLWGHQDQSLKRILTFAKQREMSMVFVSMPLTELYLDSVRQKPEAAFIAYMNKAAKSSVLTFHDFSRLWPNRHEFFIDPSHVNRYGAVSISQELGQILEQRLLQWLIQKRHS